ncbi:MAG: hypothetical protein GWN71_18810, partial [Gammaproteobacteria bacterium]|nr:hypothetical protein [Gemmatimonadota bacterium]NIU75549.1 hypothetical protein [Gammaproteobacteria bacterium]
METADGTAMLIAEGTVRGSARECPEDLGRGAVWTYDRLDGRLRARSPGPAAGWAVRGLRGGRLTDQIALGPPVTGSDGSGLYHLVATAAGVVRFDHGGSTAAVWAPEHAGLERGAVPAALHLDEE